MIKTAVPIDGGFLRANANKAKKNYNPDFIEAFAHACRAQDELLFRILYYDCAPFSGTLTLPVSGTIRDYPVNDGWLNLLSQKDLFAVRRGVLKFRGFVPKKPHRAGSMACPKTTFTDAGFKPDFEQKGVDMRIGLDVAAFSLNRAIDRTILVTGDTDCIPALKYGRKAGLQTILVEPNGN